MIRRRFEAELWEPRAYTRQSRDAAAAGLCCAERAAALCGPTHSHSATRLQRTRGSLRSLRGSGGCERLDTANHHTKPLRSAAERALATHPSHVRSGIETRFHTRKMYVPNISIRCGKLTYGCTDRRIISTDFPLSN